jgi:hypothetical protein
MDELERYSPFLGTASEPYYIAVPDETNEKYGSLAISHDTYAPTLWSKTGYLMLFLGTLVLSASVVVWLAYMVSLVFRIKTHTVSI